MNNNVDFWLPLQSKSEDKKIDDQNNVVSKLKLTLKM